MIKSQAEYIRRLNVLLKLPRIDLRTVTDAGLQTILDDFYWAIFGTKNRRRDDDTFHAATTPARPAIARAQDGLSRELTSLRHDTEPLELELAPQTLCIAANDQGFSPRYVSKDFPTMVYSMLAYLLERSHVGRSDLLTCANVRCLTVFVPVRRRSETAKTFCSPKCANLIAARHYRERKAEELKLSERERNHEKYVKRVHKKHPNAPIGRRPRTPKKLKPSRQRQKNTVHGQLVLIRLAHSQRDQIEAVLGEEFEKFLPYAEKIKKGSSPSDVWRALPPRLRKTLASAKA